MLIMNEGERLNKKEKRRKGKKTDTMKEEYSACFLSPLVFEHSPTEAAEINRTDIWINNSFGPVQHLHRCMNVSKTTKA